MLSVTGHEHGTGASERDFEHGVVLRVRDICRAAGWDVDRRRGANIVEGRVHTRRGQPEFADSVAPDLRENVLAGYVGEVAGEEPVNDPLWHPVERKCGDKDIRVDTDNQWGRDLGWVTRQMGRRGPPGSA